MKVYTKTFRSTEEELADASRQVVHEGGGPSMLVYEVRVTGDEVEAFCFVSGGAGRWFKAGELRQLSPFNVKLFTS